MEDTADICLIYEKSINDKVINLFTHDNRKILIQWLYETLYYGDFVNVTPFPQIIQMTMQYVDRYAIKVNVEADEIQLLGITSFWIAIKINEGVHIPAIRMSEQCAKTYSSKQILDMEKKICYALNWDFMSKKTMYETCITVAKTISFDIFPDIFNEKSFQDVFSFFNDLYILDPCFYAYDKKTFAYTIVLLTIKFWNFSQIGEIKKRLIRFNFALVDRKAEDIIKCDEILRLEMDSCNWNYVVNSDMIPFIAHSIWPKIYNYLDL
jgi:hypothetical protein